MLATDKSKVFLRDGLVPFERANLSIASSPVLYGLSVYSVFGVHWNSQDEQLYMFRLRDHYERLVNSCRIVDFDTFEQNWSYQRFEREMRNLLTSNHVRQDVLVRATVFVDEILAGTKMHGLTINLSAFIYPIGEFLPLSGARLCVSSWLRTPDNAIPARAKVNGSYINSALMKNEALLNGYDDAISVDEQGHVCESTVANLFLIKDGELITPDGSTHLLEGITRDSVFKLADFLGVKHQQRSLDRSELYLADEVFVCGSSARITPVISIDNRSINNGKPGSLTQKLMKLYESAQKGEMSEFADWLTSV